MHFTAFQGVSTHSRLKAAGGAFKKIQRGVAVSTHSRLKAAGRINHKPLIGRVKFQHTAA